MNAFARWFYSRSDAQSLGLELRLGDIYVMIWEDIGMRKAHGLQVIRPTNVKAFTIGRGCRSMNGWNRNVDAYFLDMRNEIPIHMIATMLRLYVHI